MERTIMASDTSPTAQQLGKRVYLDVCALNRPLDDQNQMRIRLEADAVQLILSYVRSRDLVLVISPAHRVEIAANPDPARGQHVESLIAEIGTDPDLDLGRAQDRAVSLLNQGLKPADAAHAALAEEAGCDFVIVDDRLLRQLQRAAMTVWFGNPVAYCEKEGLR
jgi:predicted nucleic acid-binding protein